MAETKIRPPTITLDAGANPDANVLVDDGSRFVVMGIGDAVDSCIQGHRARGAAQEEVKHVVEFLQDWFKKNDDVASVLHITIGGGKFFMLCAPRGREYDFNLGDRLADLLVKLTESYRLFSFDAVQCPPEGFAGFAEFKGVTPHHAD